MTIALTAKGKLGGADQTLAVPAVTLNVVRPAALELAAPGVEVKAGATVEVKGKVVRKGPFKEPVTVKLNGLPGRPEGRAGRRSPRTSRSSPSRSSPTPRPPPRRPRPTSRSAFQVNKKDYPTPPAPLPSRSSPAK